MRMSDAESDVVSSPIVPSSKIQSEVREVLSKIKVLIKCSIW